MAKSKARVVLGLNSGTSVDGVDAVACKIVGQGLNMRVQYVGHVSRAFPTELRDRLLAVMAPAATTTEELCRLNTAVGEAFATTAEKCVRRLRLKRVDLVGSHGQTICHLPPRRGGRLSRGRKKGGETGTLQIGDAAIISARLGAPVVSGFRQADMAVGGQGAPLVPWTDYVLFRDAKRGRIVQNIGGIANLTWLPPGARPEDVIAFDCGPGNMLIDALCMHFSDGKRRFDRNGAWAAKGRVCEEVLDAMMAHPFLKRKPPKSCGREEFGESFMHELLKRFARRRLSEFDWVATATRFTATCIVRAYEQLVTMHVTRSSHSTGQSDRPYQSRDRKEAESVHREGVSKIRGRVPPLGDCLDEVILCGGGERNRLLVARLIESIDRNDVISGGGTDPMRVAVTSTDLYGIPIQAKEGLSFAMLAAARMDGMPANLPQVTGAMRRVVLGDVTDVA